MRKLNDALGLALSTDKPDAVSAFDRMTEEVLAHGRAAGPALAATLAADPSLAIAHAVRGLMLLGFARAELVADAQSALSEAQRLVHETAPSGREKSYVEALALWLAGRPLHAATVLDSVVEREPRDVLAFKFAHAIRFQAGDLTGMCDAARRFAPGFAGTLHEGFVLGCRAFAEEEDGKLITAEHLARRAIELAPRDAWGRHALAHVLETSGRAREGAQWLGASTASWAHCNNFSYHMYWHLALFELELGRADAALDLYDREIRADRTDDYCDLANGASLLARLELDGVSVGDRWQELADIAARRVSDRRLVFADLHYLVALTGAGRQAEANVLIGALRADARYPVGHDADVVRRVGVTAASALSAFHTGDYALAAAMFELTLPKLAAIGGSHAQRDLFEQYTIEALTRAGDLARATALLESRLARRGGRNMFAVRRLATLAANSRARSETKLNLRFAALAVAMTPPALAH